MNGTLAASRVQSVPGHDMLTARVLVLVIAMRRLAYTSILVFIALGIAAVSVSLFQTKSPRGLDFILQNSPTPQKYLIETMPGGVALLDYNNDGLLDIFLVNGGRVTSPMRLPENFDRKDPATGTDSTGRTKTAALPTLRKRRA